jgi:4'-phosphopantetheinyl transferase
MEQKAYRERIGTHDTVADGPMLSADEVRVVRFSCGAAVDDREALLALLDKDERGRAAQFSRERDRNVFVEGHAMTRMVLGRCLGEPPAALRFRYGPYGKPELAEGRQDLRFNLTQSSDRGMLAISLGRRVGIDLEREQPIDVFTIARQFFSPAEYAALCAESASRRLSAFYRCWTHKESFVKALGDGLSSPLASFDMSVEENGSSLLLACRTSTAAGRWRTIAVPTEDGYAASLTVEGRDWRMVGVEASLTSGSSVEVTIRATAQDRDCPVGLVPA